MSGWHDNGLDKDLIETARAVTESAVLVVAKQLSEKIVEQTKTHIKNLSMDKNKIQLGGMFSNIKMSDLNDFTSGKMDDKKVNKYAFAIIEKVVPKDFLLDKLDILQKNLKENGLAEFLCRPVMELVVQEAKRRNLM